MVNRNYAVHVLVSLLPCDLRPQKENQSLTVNTDNERINTFIYDDVMVGEMGGAYCISFNWILLIRITVI
jgi:hypothetical protein